MTTKSRWQIIRLIKDLKNDDQPSGTETGNQRLKKIYF